MRRSVGVEPQAEHLGLMSSEGDSYVAEQPSHWSPRAPCVQTLVRSCWRGRSERETHVLAALGAGTLDVTIGEEPLVLLAVELLVLVLLHPSVLVQLEEDVLADPAAGKPSQLLQPARRVERAYTVC